MSGRPKSCEGDCRKTPINNRASSATNSPLRTLAPLKYTAAPAVLPNNDRDVLFTAVTAPAAGIRQLPIYQRLAPISATSDVIVRAEKSHLSRCQSVPCHSSSDKKSSKNGPGFERQKQKRDYGDAMNINGDFGREKLVETGSYGDVDLSAIPASCNGVATRQTDDSDSDDDSSSDSEPIKAPTELLMEFLDCVMKTDYVTAQKLCKMILIYEPNNSEALKFQPLIEDKIALGKTSEEAQTSSEDETDDGSNTSSSGSDDSDESSSTENDESSAMQQYVNKNSTTGSGREH